MGGSSGVVLGGLEDTACVSGRVGGVGKNLTVIGWDEAIVVVELSLGFPGESMLGVALLLSTGEATAGEATALCTRAGGCAT